MGRPTWLSMGDDAPGKSGVTDAFAEVVLEGLFFGSPRWRRLRFRRHPVRWLRGKRWEQDPDYSPPRAYMAVLVGGTGEHVPCPEDEASTDDYPNYRREDAGALSSLTPSRHPDCFSMRWKDGDSPITGVALYDAEEGGRVLLYKWFERTTYVQRDDLITLDLGRDEF